jgi:uncharacterized protein YndB with AHSA1/START domain
MILNKETVYTKDAASKKIHVERDFEAPVDKVWKAWTTPQLLDQWWAPKPWKANTISQDFREGGRWLYYMEGPDGTRHYCLADYSTIIPGKRFVGDDAFCDEKGNKNNDMPSMHWDVQFLPVEGGTKVKVEISFTSEEELEKIIEMGFKEGFAAAHNNLDDLLKENQK